jgi:RNA polymerase sigma factor (sigma-70 family)
VREAADDECEQGGASSRNPSGRGGVEATVVGRPLTETELVERARRGDQDAYGELVQRYQGIAFRTAYLLTGNAADAEDAAQEGFVKAFYALVHFRRGAELRPWLLRIVANEARNRRRSAGRRGNLALRVAAAVPSGGAAPSPEASVLDAERSAVLLEALNGLREEERDVVACRYLLELSEEETAETLGLRRGTVKSRLSRALAHLRQRLPVGDV